MNDLQGVRVDDVERRRGAAGRVGARGEDQMANRIDREAEPDRASERDGRWRRRREDILTVVGVDEDLRRALTRVREIQTS